MAVINIITKKRAEGGPGRELVTGGAAENGRRRDFAHAGYGGSFTGKHNYRIFTSYQKQTIISPILNGRKGEDGWHLLHGRFSGGGTRASQKDSLDDGQGDVYPEMRGRHIVHSIFLPPKM